jgi:VCBS repeat-containing protein
LNNDAALVQALAQGQTVEDSFAYTVTDNHPAHPRAEGAALRIIIAGSNDAPVVAADSAELGEDGITATEGNVLANDSDVDAGSTLSVTDTGSVVGTYGTFTLDATGNYSYTLNNGGAGVQSLRGDESVTESFTYSASDGMVGTPGVVTIRTAGRNDAPLALNDQVTVAEDGVALSAGNVLANDSDPDRGTLLRVTNAGSFTGAYGSLNLAVDGSYSYQLDNASSPVQALAVGQIVMETFSYTVLDNDTSAPLSSSAALEVLIRGANDAPILAQAIADQNGAENREFQFELPVGTFSDVDKGDRLSLSATLADGNLLPGWLVFDAATGAFQGTPAAGNAGVFAVKVIATDTGGLSTADTFTVTIGGQGLNLKGTDGFDRLSGSDYDDRIEGMGGWDWLLGKGGNDTLWGGAGNDLLEGGAGADRLFGEAGIDWLLGNEGNDLLDGGSNPDVMMGGSGDDTYVVDNRFDVLWENRNEGVDTVESSVSRILAANLENLTLTGAGAINGAGNELNNSLTGNAAANTLSGELGNDTLNGGSGNDILTGGAGQDIFQLMDLSKDTITDFSVADDTIQLENSVFTQLTATGVLNADNFKIGAGAADANDYVIYNSATGALFYDADGSGMNSATQIVQLGPNIALTYADFFVI